MNDNYDDLEILLEECGDMVDYYRSDPVMAAHDLLKVDLAPIQRIILRDMWFKNYTITVAGRGSGKTYLLGVNALLHSLLYPGYRVGLLSPSFRQSKMIFAEVEKIYNRSVIVQEACEKRPTKGSDTCYLKFKSTATSNGSFIEALPIGVDGAKIRGSRFYLIEIDELAQMPTQIIDMVVRPMGATVMDPMEKVREIERVQELIERGLATEDDLDLGSANKMIMTSSGYFKFNHMWRRMKSYWNAIKHEGAKTRYAVHQIPYQLLPKGFLDLANIDEARRTMSNIEFMMEYEAAMVSDSDGFFKASLIEGCLLNSTFSVQTTGDAGKEYVLGIDPNQGGGGKNAMCGIVVIELGAPNRLVNVIGIEKNTMQGIVSVIQGLCNKFNIIRIFMDSQGGGKSVKDLLQEGYNDHTPILDIEDEATLGKNGKRILSMINPSPQWISDANFDTLATMENKDIVFPIPSIDGNEMTEKRYEYVQMLKSQLLNIVVTETGRGLRHFDTPRKGQNKDLYSAFVLGCWGVKELARSVGDDNPMLHGMGLVRPHKPGASFVNVYAFNEDKFKYAELTRRIN